ncbi:MAG: DUF3379 family protein [Wenzhouxiangella sp.]|jgi:hypothetical protein|nr:DUF3379 family protein [Wenzhouxiangella sp.]
MNLLEFKRRLMTDPDSRDADFVAARRQGGDFAEAAAASDEFEKQLRSALDVPAPDHLAEDIILAQSMQPKRSVPRLTLFAAAACLVLAVGTLVWQGNGAIDGPTLDQHLVWHWELDGPAAIAASQQGTPDLDEAHRILAELGLHMDHALLESVRLSKFCPTPDGAGAHLILASEAGPITLFYMPRTRVADAPRVVSLPDGMEGRVINLERGSMAIIANAERDTVALVREIEQQLSVVPGMTL